jgi:hypothetical protein
MPPGNKLARSRLRHVGSCLSAYHARLSSGSSGSGAGAAPEAALGAAAAAAVVALPPSRVLSIQSHIVHGNLGNKCAVLPLQLLGFEVDNISTVQYSHMGAGRTGSILTAAELNSLMDGLDAQGLLGQYTHILTGWAAEAELLHAVANAVRRIQSANPAVVYLCDPVLGDNGSLYTPEGLAQIYAEELLPLVGGISSSFIRGVSADPAGTVCALLNNCVVQR